LHIKEKYFVLLTKIYIGLAWKPLAGKVKVFGNS